MADRQAAASQPPGRRRGYRLTAIVFVIMMLGGTLPVPLYVLYEKQMGFGPLGVTVVFAAYVLGTLLALVLFGDLSDHVGRRVVLSLAVVAAAISTGLFLGASGIGLLVVARVVSGIATGFATGTATAGLVELQPRSDSQAAAVAAAGASMTGLGLGPVVAGAFAEYIAVPLRSVFWAYLGLCALALAAVGVIPETVRRRDRRLRIRPEMAVPPGMRPVMVGASLGVFAAFAVLGLFSSLVPTFLHGILGVHNLLLVGGASFVIFITAAISQAVSAGLPARRSVSIGVPLLVLCLAGLETALFSKALWVFVTGTIAGGVAVGFIFRGGLSELNRIAAPQHRAAVISTFFAVAYVGLGLPAVLAGLISLAVGPVDASAYVSGLVAGIVVVAFFVVRRAFGRVSAPGQAAVRTADGRRPAEQPWR